MPKWQRTFVARKKQSDQTLDNKIRILIVDDHPIVRRGLAELVNHDDDFAVYGQAEDYHEVLRAIGELNPNMAVVDISLKETSGLELTKDIHSQHPDLPVFALSMHDETLYAERALRAGAMGYIMKQSSPAHRSRLQPLSRQPRYFQSFFLICPALEGVSKIALASPGCKAPWLCRPASTIEPTSPASAFVPWGFSLGLGPTINF